MVKYLSYFFIALSLTLSACSHDDAPAVQSVPYVMFGMADHQPVVEWQPSAGARAGETPLPAPELPTTIGVYGFNDVSGVASEGYGEVFANEQMYLSDIYGYEGFDAVFPANDNHWPYYDPRPWIGKAHYRFAAYGPYTSGVRAELESYEGFNTMIFDGLSYYSDTELLVSNTIVQYQSVSAGNAVQHFTLTHPMARVRLCFKLGPKYADMRIIHITKIEVDDPRPGSCSLTVRYVEDGDGYLPIFDWSLTNGAPGASRSVELSQDASIADDGYLELSKANGDVYLPYGSLYACPVRNSGLASMGIHVTYDVFDLTGQLLRKDETVTNNIVFKQSYPLRAAYYYDVNLVVEPTFLYVLSDNDPDPTAEGYLVINDNR